MLHATIGLSHAFLLAFQSRDQDALAAGLDQEQPGIIQGPLGTKLGVLVDKEIKKVVLSSGDAEKRERVTKLLKRVVHDGSWLYVVILVVLYCNTFSAIPWVSLAKQG